MTKAVFKTTATKVVPQKILEATGRSPTLRILLQPQCHSLRKQTMGQQEGSVGKGDFTKLLDLCDTQK